MFSANCGKPTSSKNSDSLSKISLNRRKHPLTFKNCQKLSVVPTCLYHSWWRYVFKWKKNFIFKPSKIVLNFSFHQNIIKSWNLAQARNWKSISFNNINKFDESQTNNYPTWSWWCSSYFLLIFSSSDWLKFLCLHIYWLVSTAININYRLKAEAFLCYVNYMFFSSAATPPNLFLCYKSKLFNRWNFGSTTVDDLKSQIHLSIIFTSIAIINELNKIFFSLSAEMNRQFYWKLFFLYFGWSNNDRSRTACGKNT